MNLNFTGEENDFFSKYQREKDAALLKGQDIRKSTSIVEQIQALQQCDPYSSYAEENLVGALFVETWAQLFTSTRIPKIANSQACINWHAATLAACNQRIHNHVEISQQLCQTAMKGDWTEVASILTHHQSEFGPSLWSLNWLLLVAEEQNGSTYRTELANEFDEYGDFASFMAETFGYAVDQNIPESTYRQLTLELIGSGDKVVGIFLRFLVLGEIEDPWESSDVMWCFDNLCLIDRYELFLKIARLSISTGHRDAIKFNRAIEQLLQHLPLDTFKYLLECANPNWDIKKTGLGNLFISAWDSYVSSDYPQCISLCDQIRAENPCLLGPHELIVKAQLYLGYSDSSNKSETTNLLQHHLRNLFSKNENSEESLSFLQRFATRFPIDSLAMPLRALCAQSSPQGQTNKTLVKASLSYLIHGPRNFEYGHGFDVNHSYLSKLLQTYPDSLAVNFFHTLYKRKVDCSLNQFKEVPEIRKLFFRGLSYAKQGLRASAVVDLDHFLEKQTKDRSNPLSPFAVEEALRVVVDIHKSTGDLLAMQSALVKAYVERQSAIRRLDIKQMYSIAKEMRRQTGTHIGYSFLAHLACDNPHEVSLALKRFLRQEGLEKPSELKNSKTLDKATLALLFLRVCNVEVLDSFITLNTVAKVEKERLQLLEWICKETPAFSRAAETEVLRLMQHSQLREALNRIDGARIALNITSLRDAEKQKYSDTYYRYIAQKNLIDETTEEDFRKANEGGRTLDKKFLIPLSTIERRKILFHSFAQTFLDVRDSFITSPHFGVEASLSGKIRHGILVQHIKQPFVGKRLAVVLGGPEEREIRAYWADELGVVADSPKLNAIIAILHDLTLDVDTLAVDVRDNWIQTRTECNGKQGLFNYVFTHDDLIRIRHNRDEMFESLEVFLDNVFEVLLDRTKASLKRVQERIADDLSSSLQGAINKAIGRLKARDLEWNTTLLRDELVSCLAETEQSCRQMIRWFQVTDATLLGDADMALVARTAIGMVEKLNPDYQNRHKCDTSGQFRIRGRFFTSIVHIFFFLLDNAIHHSNVSRDSYSCMLRVEADATHITVVVSNRMLRAEDAERAASSIKNAFNEASLNLNPERINREGGSGFAKLIATVRYDFKMPDPTFEVSGDDKFVCLRLSINSTGIYA